MEERESCYSFILSRTPHEITSLSHLNNNLSPFACGTVQEIAESSPPCSETCVWLTVSRAIMPVDPGYGSKKNQIMMLAFSRNFFWDALWGSLWFTSPYYVRFLCLRALTCSNWINWHQGMVFRGFSDAVVTADWLLCCEGKNFQNLSNSTSTGKFH
jgi:hypothetical protein